MGIGVAMAEFTLDERTAISRAFDAGNYANAYESQDLLKACAKAEKKYPVESKKQAWCDGFVLGFFSSYEIKEIPLRHRGFYLAAQKRQKALRKQIG